MRPLLDAEPDAGAVLRLGDAVCLGCREPSEQVRDGVGDGLRKRACVRCGEVTRFRYVRTREGSR